MFCGRCGNNMPEDARFCAACGAPLTAGAATGDTAAGWQTAGGYNSAPGTTPYLNRLQRPRANRMIAGVCAGLAQHYGWELTWVRVVTVLLTVFSSGAGLIAYIVFWLVMPEQPWALPQNVGIVEPPQSPPIV